MDKYLEIEIREQAVTSTHGAPVGRELGGTGVGVALAKWDGAPVRCTWQQKDGLRSASLEPGYLQVVAHAGPDGWGIRLEEFMKFTYLDEAGASYTEREAREQYARGSKIATFGLTFTCEAEVGVVNEFYNGRWVRPLPRSLEAVVAAAKAAALCQWCECGKPHGAHHMVR